MMQNDIHDTMYQKTQDRYILDKHKDKTHYVAVFSPPCLGWILLKNILIS